MCDIDIGRRMVFGSKERREQMRKREKRTEIMREREEREIPGKKRIKFFFFFYKTATVQFYL